MQRVEIALKFIILINIYQVDTLVLLVGIIIGLSAPRTGRLHFGFRSSFDRTTKRTRCRHLFFFFLIAFAIFALLFSLPPSRISDPGSHSRLFFSMMGAHTSETLILCSKGKAQIVQTNSRKLSVRNTAQNGQQHEKK